MRRLGVICAFREELMPALAAYPITRIGSDDGDWMGRTGFGKLQIDFGAVGVGMLDSFAGTNRFIDAHRPQQLLLVGISGGLHPSLERGDAVLAETLVVSPDLSLPLPSLHTSAALNTIVAGALERQGNLHRGIIYTHYGGVVCAAAEKARICEKTAARAVDMESFAVAAACAARSVPLAVLRFISDSVRDDLPLWLADSFQSRSGLDLTVARLHLSRNPTQAVMLHQQFATATVSLSRCLSLVINAFAQTS